MINSGMDVLPCISVAGSVLLTLTCCVASSELATTFVPSNKPSDHHYHGATQSLIGKSDITSFDDVTNMAPTDLSPDEDITTTQLSLAFTDALNDHGIDSNSEVKGENVSLTTESVRSRTSHLGESKKESLKMATFLPDSSTSSYLPPHSLLKFGVEGGGTEGTPWPEEVEQTSLPGDVDAAQTLPPTAKIDEHNIRLSPTTAATASISGSTIKRRMVPKTTSSATAATDTRAHEVGRSRLHDSSKHNHRHDQDHEKEEEGLTEIYINHAALWITVAFVVVLLVYIIVLIIYNAKRRDWHQSLPPYTRFIEDSGQEGGGSSSRLEKMLRRIGKKNDVEDGYSLSF